MYHYVGGQLITIYSAPNYCGRHNNAGAVLILKKNGEIIPKLIYTNSMSRPYWIEKEG